jgi:hypothetical protein
VSVPVASETVITASFCQLLLVRENKEQRTSHDGKIESQQFQVEKK